MVAPRRIADVNRDGGGRGTNQFCAHSEGAAAPGCLYGSRAPVAAGGMRRPKNHLFHGNVEFCAARSGHIGFRGLPGQDRLLGSTHAGEHGRVAAQVAVHAYAEVDLR